MTAHTPGPWSVPHFADDDVKCNCAYVLSEGYAGAVADVRIGNGRPIGDGGNDCPPLEEAKANAHLIAAAPEMFEALTLARGHLGDLALRGEHIPSGVFKEIDAALSKARPSLTGGSSE